MNEKTLKTLIIYLQKLFYLFPKINQFVL